MDSNSKGRLLLCQSQARGILLHSSYLLYSKRHQCPKYSFKDHSDLLHTSVLNTLLLIHQEQVQCEFDALSFIRFLICNI